MKKKRFTEMVKRYGLIVPPGIKNPVIAEDGEGGLVVVDKCKHISVTRTNLELLGV